MGHFYCTNDWECRPDVFAVMFNTLLQTPQTARKVFIEFRFSCDADCHYDKRVLRGIPSTTAVWAAADQYFSDLRSLGQISFAFKVPRVPLHACRDAFEPEFANLRSRLQQTAAKGLLSLSLECSDEGESRRSFSDSFSDIHIF